MVAVWSFLLETLKDADSSSPSHFTLMEPIHSYNVGVHQIARLATRQMTETRYRMTFSYC